MKNLWAGKVEKVEKQKIAKFQISKNRKKQKKAIFHKFDKNFATTFLLSKRKHSWLFFEIGIENGFLGGTFQKKIKKCP